ncbi:MAG: methionine adenosyltransferase, partial [Clostridia bacterium]|nr:methionine adenosyltransferase [Clostridia bacterium]
AIDEQSTDIAMGVNKSLETKKSCGTSKVDMGAGDQGMMFGYAVDETPEYMPLPISLAHEITRKLAQVRKNEKIPYLLPDGKSQVTVEYKDGKPIRVDTVVVSAQHSPDVEYETLRGDIIDKVIRDVVPDKYLDRETKYFVNPTGRFVIGGPLGDTGLTGRKIIVDTYGGMARNGGGAFSGKDPTKVDRSAAYAARHIAKNIVAGGLARKCEIQISYAIGVAQPLAIHIDTFGTGKIDDYKLEKLVMDSVDLRPSAIIDNLGLQRPIYTPLSAYGHFGRRDLDLPWEKTDLVDIFLKKAKGI